MNWPFDPLRPLSYELIVADPPWRFALRSEKGQAKSADTHYGTMQLDAIKALPVGQLARGNCLLWLWATHPMIGEALDVMRAWGFRFVSSGVWVKTTKTGKLSFGTGYVLRSASEPFLIGSFGEPRTSRRVRTVLMAERREHSRKPDEAYVAAEALAIDAVRRADLFSRQTRPGWDAWGNEATKFDEVSA
ncbi:MT-A70 family methyltransferase [Microvirga roseola]|uniref:MT-A70 family methyltransferase n=1 Tax=Microvirga roseola TaxID=2883126 RepID=UPI001E5F668A|nr:MT-A70 family methyltransferase [Microvirga roseola]